MNYRLTELKVLLFLLLLSAVSCQRPMYDEEDDEDGVSQTNLPLKISARSSGESQINYPAYIYAFAEDGSCSASLKMTDNAQIEMKLPPARYTIVAFHFATLFTISWFIYPFRFSTAMSIKRIRASLVAQAI